MHELFDFARVSALYRPSGLGVLAQSVIEGHCPGRIWVDDTEQPAAALIATRMGYYYLAGDDSNEAVYTALHRLFVEELIPASLLAGERQFILFFAPDAWEQRLQGLFREKAAFRIAKKRYTLPPAAAPGDPAALPNGLTLCRIDSALLSQHPELRDEVAATWRSPEAFLRTGWGYALLEGEALLSHCVTVLVGGGEAEISIHTAAPYRRQGHAQRVAQAFLAHSVASGYAPIWGCWPENWPSRALAARLGFVEEREQPIFFWEERA